MSANLPPTYQRDQRKIWDEISKLWRRLGGAAQTSSGPTRYVETEMLPNGQVWVDVPFNIHGPLVDATTDVKSPPHYLPGVGGTLDQVIASLATAGTSTTTVRIFKNGVQLATTISLASGVDKTIVDFDDWFDGDEDSIQVDLSAIGTGAVGLNVQLRFLP